MYDKALKCRSDGPGQCSNKVRGKNAGTPYSNGPRAICNSRAWRGEPPSFSRVDNSIAANETNSSEKQASEVGRSTP